MEILLDTLKWSAVTGAAALVLTALKPLLDKRYSPKWRYGVWLVLAAMLLLAPVQWERFLPQAPAPAVTIQVPRVEVAVSREEGVRLQTPAASAAPAPSGTAAPERVLELDRVLTALWLSGAAAFALYHLAGTAFLQRRARRWSRAPGPETMALYAEVQTEMALRRVPPVRVSSQVDSPLLAGLLRPCLFLPAEDFAPQELRFILRHELTHWKRRDLWYKLVLLAANAVHWFNPLVYLMSREASRDIELTCDALVVAGADVQVRRAYSETLLASIHRQHGGQFALTTHFYGGAEVMKERFKHILGRQGRKWGGFVLALTLLLTIVTACAVGISQAAGPENLSREELDVWQERLNEDPELEPYLRRMYTDPAYLPSEEVLESLQDPTKISLGYADLDLTVVSGVRDGDTVTLELEGWFTSQLTAGTLTLVDEKPVSLTTPLYTAVEKMAWDFVNASAIAGEGVEIADRCITNLWCSDTFQLDGRDWYVWELAYVVKPADIGQVILSGSMEEHSGWVIDFYNAPVLIVSGRDGGYILEYTAAQYTKEYAYTWQDYVYGTLSLGLDLETFPVLNGWPEIDAAQYAGDPPPADAAPENEDAQSPAPEDEEIPDDPLGYETQPGELTPDELESFSLMFNPEGGSGLRNGLLRFPYDNFDGIADYLEILFYDAGESVSDPDELAALEERMGTPIETDCFRLTRDYIRESLTWNFAESISQDRLDKMIEENFSQPNLPAYDAFYLIHGDTMLSDYQFDRGVREPDGTVKLYYTTNLWVYEGNGVLNILWDQPMCATLALGQTTGVWSMVSNTIVE